MIITIREVTPKLKLEERLFKHRKIDDTTSCWLWIGNTSKSGYGKIQYEGGSQRVHRISAFLWLDYNLKSPEPICHRRECLNKNCFNPEHLYIGTNSLNTIDSVILKTHRNSRKTHCPQGHEYTEANTRVDINGCKHCVICNTNYYEAHKNS